MDDMKIAWGVELFAGLLWILLGSAALFLPVISTFSIVLVFGWVLIIGGLVQCVYILFDWTKHSGVRFLMGVLSLLFGSVLVLNLYAGAVAITTIIGIFFLMQSSLMLLVGVLTSKTDWLMIVGGALSLVGAFIILGNLLESSLFLVGLLLGVQMIMFGFALVAEATFKADDPSKFRAALGWFLVVVIGIVLLVAVFDDNFNNNTDAIEVNVVNEVVESL